LSIFFLDPKPKAHDDTVTIGTTLTQIVGHSKRRLSVIIVNTTNQTLTLTRNPAGIAGKGLFAEQGEGYEWNKYRGDDVTNPIFGIVAANTATVCFEEELDRGR